MIVDAYQQILRNVEIQPKKVTRSDKVRADNAASNWFAQYAPALSHLWDKTATK